jgi:drug/metabolite transporter (DMT)-like permease
MNLSGILSKISAESLLSLYPSFVKNINLDLGKQLWSRFFVYVFLSSFFVDWSYIRETIVSKWGISLVLVTILHVYTSYRGFQLLEGGIAYSIFYTYPLFILLMSREAVHPILLLSIVGVYLLASESTKPGAETMAEPMPEPMPEPMTEPMAELEEKSREKEATTSSTSTSTTKYLGLSMVFLAALTEAAIYFIVKRLPTKNNWNHIFLSYGLGAVGLTAYYLPQLTGGITSTVAISLVINAIIGLFGYLLRFYSIGVLPPLLYSSLSYVGIFMAYVYGVVFNGEQITGQKIGGTALILLSNVYVLYKKYY